MQKTLSNNRILIHFRHLRLVEKLLIQGLIVTVVLVIFQNWLIGARDSFTSYIPPIGFALFLTATYFVQPLVIGVLNIITINSLYKTNGWQVGFWLNGIFLVLVFSTINLMLETVFQLPFFPYVALIDILLAFPFGCIARFSNGSWKKPLN